MNPTADNTKRRKEYLNQILKTTPISPEWERWLEKSGELPPDFETMTPCWDLPDPLTIPDQHHSVITSTAAWEKKRPHIQDHFTQWFFGKTPKEIPNISPEICEEQTCFKNTYKKIRLHFGPDKKAFLTIELFIPEHEGTLPVFMTQTNHRSWAKIALQRGYLAVLYNACDAADDTESLVSVYPEADWSLITRRAWAASRVVDYLETIPEANAKKIILTGHSRNGKQSLITSAYDERIFAVIASSAGAIGSNPTRFFSEQHFGEGIELITRRFPTWFHPRLRFFVGREQYLPVDMHELIALSAPRPCLISTAVNDVVESVWAVEQTYRAAGKVYQLYGKKENLAILWRAGGHETYSEIIEKYLDWCDAILKEEKTASPEFLFPVNIQPQQGKERLTPCTTNLEEKIRSLLGEEPPWQPSPNQPFNVEDRYIAKMLFREEPQKPLKKEQVIFGEYINADIYSRADQDNKEKPIVLWLSPLSLSHGYQAGYFYGEQFYQKLAKQGYTVFCYDHIGMGRRVLEAQQFYKRYPNWSLFGKMLQDAKAAMLMINQYLDGRNNPIIVVGYGLGALIGHHLAAVETQVSGLVSICPPVFYGTPTEKAFGSLTQYHLHTALIPKLAFYEDDLQDLPYDLSELIKTTAPRPQLLLSPSWNRETDPQQIRQIANSIETVYQKLDQAADFTFLQPEDYNHLSESIQEMAIQWLNQQFAQSEQINAYQARKGIC